MCVCHGLEQRRRTETLLQILQAVFALMLRLAGTAVHTGLSPVRDPSFGT
jgi:hypothetical protein